MQLRIMRTLQTSETRCALVWYQVWCQQDISALHPGRPLAVAALLLAPHGNFPDRHADGCRWCIWWRQIHPHTWQVCNRFNNIYCLKQEASKQAGEMLPEHMACLYQGWP